MSREAADSPPARRNKGTAPEAVALLLTSLADRPADAPFVRVLEPAELRRAVSLLRSLASQVGTPAICEGQP